MNRTLFSLFRAKDGYQPIFEKLYFMGLYGMNFGRSGSVDGEVHTIEYVKAKLSKTVTLFDIGANIGEYTKNLIKIFSDTTYTIYSFEPASATFDTLSKNLRHENSVNLFKTGLGKENGQLTFYGGLNDSKVASLFKSSKFSNDSYCETIEIQTLDYFCKLNRINNIDFLKIDSEGNDYAILEGASNMINHKQIKFIQFEFGPFNIESRCLFKDFYDLLNDKYYLYRILKDGLFKINKYDESLLEIFMTSNYLAELK